MANEMTYEEFRTRVEALKNQRSTAAPEHTSGDWGYDLMMVENVQKAKIVKYTGTATTMTIPATIDGYDVYQVGDGSIMDIPSTVSRVEFPEGLVKIYWYAFTDRNILSISQFPSTLEEISDGAFSGCPLTDMDVLVIPETVTSIGGYAFSDTAPKRVEIFGYGAFRLFYNGSLGPGGPEEAIIGGACSYIDNTFTNCYNLKTITVNPMSWFKFHGDSLMNCTSLETITLHPARIEFDDYDSQTLSNCPELTDVYLTRFIPTISEVRGDFKWDAGTTTKPVTITIHSPNNNANRFFDAFTGQYTTIVYKALVVYKYAKWGGNKIQVESAVRDGLGNRIDTTYAKKNEVAPVNISTGDGLIGGPITGTGTISHDTSGVTAGSYQEVTVDQLGHVTQGKKIFTFTHIYLEEVD